MKMVIRNILIGIVLLASTNQAFAYPPDNAAVLYYKSFMLLEEPNDAMKKKLRDLSDGNTALNEQIRQYVYKNRKVINEVVTAAEIKNCDWGHNLSEGPSMPLPELAKFRLLCYLLVADVKIHAEQSNYPDALERCLTIHKMGRHAGDDILIHILIGIAMGSLANNCIADILPQVSNDLEVLHWLREQLDDVSSRGLDMKTAIANETNMLGEQINREEVLAAIAEGEIINRAKVPKEILEGDEEFFAKAREYWYSVMTRTQRAYDLPYLQAYHEFENLSSEVKKAASEKPEAKITEFLFPAIGRVYSIETRFKTHTNAVLAGIDIYIIRAKTGKLPDELPAGLPKDLFSGKDFLYEKTDAGFVLKCQGKDLSKDVVHQFEFKVGK